MDTTTVLQEIDGWPVEERLRLVQAVWDGIVERGSVPEPTEAQRTELDHRLAAMEATPEEATPGEVVPWETVREQARRLR